LRKTIEVYQGFIVAINQDDFQADLYRQDDQHAPFAFGTFYNHIITKTEIPRFIVGNTFTFEIYREDGDIKWTIQLHENKDGSITKINP
jgi:hypothetical protein